MTQDGNADKSVAEFFTSLKGEQGWQGPQGERGPAGQNGYGGMQSTVRSVGANGTISCASSCVGFVTTNSTAVCDPMTSRLVGGGAVVTQNSTMKLAVSSSYPSGNNWVASGVVLTNNAALATNGSITAYAICATY